LAWPELIEGEERKVTRPPRVLCSELLCSRSMPFHGPRTKAGKEVRRHSQHLAIAERYAAAMKAAADETGLREAADGRESWSRGVQDLGWEIGRKAPMTLVGALIQARALSTIDQMDRRTRPNGTYSVAGLAIGRPLADAVLRLAGAGRG